MKIIDKVMKELNKVASKNEVILLCCPQKYGYSGMKGCVESEDGIETCYKCWNREIEEVIE